MGVLTWVSWMSLQKFCWIVFPQQSSKEVLSSVNGTGIAMLFSAGTFLYVATVHVLPELMSMNAQGENGSDQGRSDKMQRTDLFLMVFGIVSPLLLSQTHSHHWCSNSFLLKRMALFFFSFWIPRIPECSNFNRSYMY